MADVGEGLMGSGAAASCGVQTVLSRRGHAAARRGQYQAYSAASGMRGYRRGAVIGGVFAEHLPMVEMFLDKRTTGLACWRLLAQDGQDPGVSPPGAGFDWLGGVIMMQPLSLFMLVLTWGGKLSRALARIWDDRERHRAGAGFVWHAENAEEQFLPLSLMGDRCA